MCSMHNETLLRQLHVEVHIRSIYAKYVATPTKSNSYVDGCQNVGKRAAAGVLMEQRKDKYVHRSLVHKIKEGSDWRAFSVQLPCLPTCNYDNGSDQGQSMLATQPTFSIHNSVSIVF